jgi:hypothetical protein
MQSIGRGMRLHKDKEYVNIYDFIDDFRAKHPSGGYVNNYTWDHGKKRLEYYKDYYADAEMGSLTIENMSLKNIENPKLF